MMLEMNEIQIIKDVTLKLNSSFNSVEKISFAFFFVPVLKSSPIDKHEVKEVWVILKGCGEVTIEGETIKVSVNDMIFIDELREHVIKNIGVQDLMVLSIWWNS